MSARVIHHSGKGKHSEIYQHCAEKKYKPLFLEGFSTEGCNQSKNKFGRKTEESLSPKLNGNTQKTSAYLKLFN